MKYKCYLCEKKIETNDLFASITIHIENQGDIIHDLVDEKICSHCANRFGYLRNIIKEGLKKNNKK